MRDQVRHRLQHNVWRQIRLLRRHIRDGPIFTLGRHVQRRRVSLAALFGATNRFLQDLGVDYWLIHGTLLGYHRNGRPLDRDVDVDFGAPERAFARIWQARGRLPAGYRMYDTSFNHHGPKLYIEWNGWEADIYFYGEADGLLHPYERDSRAGYEKPFARELVYPLQEARFLGETTYIPARPEALLAHIYGYIGADAVWDSATGYWRQHLNQTDDAAKS